MSSADLLKEAKHLSVAERLDLIDQLIESVEVDSRRRLMPDLEAELDRRHKEYLAHPEQGEPWEVIREKIRRELDGATDDRQA